MKNFRKEYKNSTTKKESLNGTLWKFKSAHDFLHIVHLSACAFLPKLLPVADESLSQYFWISDF